ncbi:MAG: Mrp/NBP35 family ATP-binding protein [Bacillales bacterium]|nr:Mrp/NBP35 family ATP-binding protein [Bacillales bacterium]
MGCNHDCANCHSNCGSSEIEKLKLNDRSSIKHIVGVLSGKGGVGKSLVTSLLAVKLSKMGLNVGVLDADITGPSMAKSFGIFDKAYQQDDLILPYITKLGIKVISTNMLLANDDDPIIWRGSLISNLVQQYYKDVRWEELDVLLIDMPPGTGDVTLTTFQQIPVDGIVIVTTPQELVSMIVKKSINMADQMGVPVVGLVENMSYVVCPNCQERIYIYGNKDTDYLSQFGYPCLSKIPFDGRLTKLVDNGEVEDFNLDYVDDLAKKIIEDMEDK